MYTSIHVDLPHLISLQLFTGQRLLRQLLVQLYYLFTQCGFHLTRDHILLVSSYNFLVVVDTNHLIGLHIRVQHVICYKSVIENSHHLVTLLNAWYTNVKKSHANSLGNREESNTVITQFPSEGFIAQDTNS